MRAASCQRTKKPSATPLLPYLRPCCLCPLSLVHPACHALQVELLVYLAHVGSFVPAQGAVVGLRDRILTRLPCCLIHCFLLACFTAGGAAGVSGACGQVWLVPALRAVVGLRDHTLTRLPCCLFHLSLGHLLCIHRRWRCWCIWHMWAALCQLSVQWWGCATASSRACPAAAWRQWRSMPAASRLTWARCGL
jgi:hypothetical protein